MDSYLSVTDFLKIANISRTTLYKKLNTCDCAPVYNVNNIVRTVYTDLNITVHHAECNHLSITADRKRLLNIKLLTHFNIDYSKLFPPEKVDSTVNDVNNVVRTVYTETNNTVHHKESTKAEQIPTDNTDPLYIALADTVELLRNQLAIKDKQIEALTNALSRAQEQAQAAQLLHAGTMQLNAPDTHKTLWQRIKEKKIKH